MEIETLVNGVITKVSSVIITVHGGTKATITSTVSLPPFTTDVINFWPIYVEPTDEPGFVLEPVPSIVPPEYEITLPAGVRTFPPTPITYPGETPSSTSTSDLGPLWFWFPTSSKKWTIQPQPTVAFPLPTTSPFPGPPSDCPEDKVIRLLKETCLTHRFPTKMTFFPYPPKETCNSAVNQCGKKNCQLFGCRSLFRP